MVCCDFYYGEEYYCQNPTGDKYALMRQVISWGDFYPVTWNKLIKTEIYKKILYPVTTYSEDRVIMTQILYYCDNMGYINRAFYHWCVIQESASRNRRNLLKGLMDDYSGYILIAKFINEQVGNLNEFTAEIINHADKLGFVCSDNKKIIELYKKSIKNIIRVIQEEKTASNEIITEKNVFETSVVKLDKKNYKKYFARLKSGIKNCILERLKKL
jgi:hypothetical protein